MPIDDPESPYWAAGSSDGFSQRMAHAEWVQQTFNDAMTNDVEEADEEARNWLAKTDQTAFVGSRHHVVPRFLLEQWADERNQVRVFHRIECRFGIRNIGDLAIKDFYTTIDKTGRKNSSMESLLGVVETATKPIIDMLLRVSQAAMDLESGQLAQLAQFAAFQATRTPRTRRELELQAEWYLKTMAEGKLPEAELRGVTVVPHQNELIELAGKSAENIFPFFACRPLVLVRLDIPGLLVCDEPVVLNAPAGAFHHDDCFLTDDEIRARLDRYLRKTKKRKRGRHPPPGRTIHFSSTAPSGFGIAHEILLAISPSAALLWGPLEDAPPRRGLERLRLVGDEAQRFAEHANTAMSAQSLDWIVGRVADLTFDQRTFPSAGPLMRVCDGINAASLAVNDPPLRFRPHRLSMPRPASEEVGDSVSYERQA